MWWLIMLLTEGKWSGRGRYLFHGQSIGIGIRTQFQILDDEHGLHVEGSVEAQQQTSRNFALRVLPDDTGLFEMTAQGFGADLQGTAKLASEPNMGMLWAETLNRHISFSVFEVSQGYGCRGFMHDESGLLTWELALQKQTGADRQNATRPGPGTRGNVVAMPTRPRRR